MALLLLAALVGVRVMSSVEAAPAGAVWAWGENGNGQLGEGSNRLSSVPVQVGGLQGVSSVAAGGAHSLALRADGTV